MGVAGSNYGYSLMWVLGGFLVFDLARRMLGEHRPATFAAALISLAYTLVLPFAMQASRSFQPDPGMVMWVVVSVYALYRWMEHPSWKWALLAGVAGGIGSEQNRGTLEVLLGTPTRLWVLLLAVTIWNTLYASIEVVLYFFVGAVGFDVNFSRINWSTLACFLGLAIIMFNSMGLVEAAWILVFKRGTVAAWAFNGVSALLGGVFFPVTVLPGWLQQIAEWNPLTHAIRGLQMGIYQGTAISDLAYEVGMLGFFCVVLVPLAAFSWRWGLRYARVEGSLCLH